MFCGLVVGTLWLLITIRVLRFDSFLPLKRPRKITCLCRTSTASLPAAVPILQLYCCLNPEVTMVINDGKKATTALTFAIDLAK